MFRRLSAWHILTAGLIGLSSACGSDARPDKAAEEKTRAELPPSVAQRGADLTGVQPAPVTPKSEVIVLEPEPRDDQEEILDGLTLAAERKPDDVGLRIKLARALLEAGKPAEARRAAEKAVEIDGSSSGAWNTLGRVEMASRDFAAAATAFQRAVEEDEDNSFAWNNLGYSLIEEKRFEEAAAALENATSGEHPTPYMWNNLGMAYEHIDRIREARAAYRQAADAGSEKGQANVERLEGVTSLRARDTVEEGELEVEPAEVVEPASVEDGAAPVEGSDAAGGPTADPQEELGC